ncbi:MAG: lamin tail domain-containing protein, partial [Candidatus Methanoplasma sp.]|nr:lamin tail domain-containing protein [Candidatus Methanoplasma sp.]
MCKYRVVVVSFLFLFLLAPIIPASEGSSDRESTKVLISEVNPFGDGEGISLFNYGRTDVNLKGWEISDGEGHLVFAKNLYLGPDSRLTVVKSVCEGDWFSGRDGVITFSDDRIQKKGSFILANTGDDIYVHNGDFLVDSMCYGNKTSEIGWVGEPADISSNRYLLRTGPEDTDSSADWTCTKPGITNHVFDPDRRYDSLVTPFSFPESQGIPIFTELEKAEREVLISMYLLTSTNLAALLCELSSDKNISVQILLEGSVLGYDMGSELMLMRSI